jgi:hypothetical protein
MYFYLFIFQKELKQALNKLGKNYSDRDIAAMIRSVDLDGNGQISIDEFAKLLEWWSFIKYTLNHCKLAHGLRNFQLVQALKLWKESQFLLLNSSQDPLAIL